MIKWVWEIWVSQIWSTSWLDESSCILWVVDRLHRVIEIWLNFGLKVEIYERVSTSCRPDDGPSQGLIGITKDFSPVSDSMIDRDFRSES